MAAAKTRQAKIRRGSASPLMKRILPFLALSLTPALTVPALAQEDELRIGVIAPEEGGYAILGEQARIAAAAFAEAASGNVTIVPAEEPCTETSGEDAASAMVEAGVDAVIGLFCAETTEAAMPVLAESDIPAITVSVRADIVMEDALSRGWPLFRLAPSEDAEARAIADILAERWVEEPFALVDDGTIYGRDLVEEIRLDLEGRGIEPVFTDTYRPAEETQFGLVRRLAGAGATHVFVGGERNDIAIMARDAAQADLNLTFMGGDALRAADGEVPLADGTLAIIAERPQPETARDDALAALETAITASPLVDAEPGDGYFLTVYAAAQLLAEANAASGGAAGEALVQALIDGTFQSAIGEVRFGIDQAADALGYRLAIVRDGELVPVDGEGASAETE